MDQQNIIFLGCITVALAISAFILWGPSPRPRKRKDHIVGLVNMGSTCFLNTLLQALASCALFLHWLTQQKHEENSLTASLHDILCVLNGEGNEAHAPVKVLSALKRHGWTVPSGEQDAHELFLVIVSTLQEENKKALQAGSLSDALPSEDTLSEASDTLDDTPDLQHDDLVKSSILYSESNIFDMDKGENQNLKKLGGQGDNGDSSPVHGDSSCGDSLLICNETIQQGDSITQSSTEVFYSLSQDSENDVKKYCGDVDESTLQIQCELSKNEECCLEMKNAIKGNPEKLKGFQEDAGVRSPFLHGCYDRATGGFLMMPQFNAPPFQGLMTSTLRCSACGYCSYLHYDTFDSLSLPLGDNIHFQPLKLQDLLRKFVKPEIIAEVDCEKCKKKTTAFKTMNFGKLPVCLCLHIARANWQSYSHTPTKRDDFIDFPEYLPMDEYTVSTRLGKTEVVDIKPARTSESEEKVYKHMYRLKSVVVHLGGVSSGHFLTYRRGALNTLRRHRIGKLAGACKDSRRWYLTSDDNVKMSSLREAMGSLAYMLFYEKCASEESLIEQADK